MVFTEAPEADKSSPQNQTPFQGMFLGHAVFTEASEAHTHTNT